MAGETQNPVLNLIQDKTDGQTQPFHDPIMKPVFDGARRRVKGLRMRGTKFYGSIYCPIRRGSVNRALRATTVAEARKELESLRVGAREGRVNVGPGSGMTLAELIPSFLTKPSRQDRAPNTLAKDKRNLERFLGYVGNLPVAKITAGTVLRYGNELLKTPKKNGKPRTARDANLHLGSIRGCLKHALEIEIIRDLPRFADFREKPSPKRELLTPEEIKRLFSVADTVSKNGPQLVNFMRLLLYSGGRKQEVLALRWEDVDFKGRKLAFGRYRPTKNREQRIVDFNPKLEAHLRDMRQRRVPDSEFLFPSPRRGKVDRPSLNGFWDSFKVARAKAGLPDAGFHDFRHAFISHAVMAGVPFLTVASWVGHKDGGILIGRVYGHLLDSHRREMALKLNFGKGV